MRKFNKFLSMVLTYIFVASMILQAVPVSAKEEVKVTDLSSFSGKTTTSKNDLDVNVDDYYSVTVLDPFGKPSKGGYISGYIGNGDQIKIGTNGTMYIKKDIVTQGQNYRINICGYTQDSGEPFVYTRDYNTSIQSFSSEGKCRKANISIIKPDNITFSRGEIVISPKDNCYSLTYEKNLEFNLTNWNKNNIWLEKGDYAVYCGMNTPTEAGKKNKQYLLLGDLNINETSANSLVLDGNKVSKVQVDGTSNYMMSFYNYPNREERYNGLELYMLYDKQYNYCLNDRTVTMNYDGILNVQPNIVNHLKIGKKLAITPSLRRANIVPGGKVEAELGFKDEYNNKVSVNNNVSDAKAIISDGAKTIASVNCNHYCETVEFTLPTEAVGQLKIAFDVTVNNIGTIKSSSFDMNVNMDSYYKITVTDPQGMPANGGRIFISPYQSNVGEVPSVDISNSGIAYIKKDTIKIGTKYEICVNGKIKENNECYLYIRDFLVQDENFKGTSIAAGNNISKVNISTTKPSSSIEDGGFYILRDDKKVFYTNCSKYIKSDDSNLENFNIWLDNGTYRFKMILKCKDASNNRSNYNLYTESIDTTKIKSVAMDCNNVSELKVSIPDKARLGQVNVIDSMKEYSDPVPIYNKTYFSKRVYSSIRVSYTNEAGSNINAYKKDFMVKDDVTEVVVGKFNIAKGSSLEMPFKFQGNLKAGAKYDYYLPSIKDFNGFEVSSDGPNANKFTLKIYKPDGTLVSSIENADAYSINIPQLEDGIYDVEVTSNIDGIGECKSQRQKVSIYSGECYNYSINDSIKSNGSFSLYDGDNKLITAGLSNNNIYGGDNTFGISKKLLQPGKRYSVLVNYCDSNNVFHSYKNEVAINLNSSYLISEPQDLVQTVITNVPSQSTKLAIDNIGIDGSVINSNGELKVKLQPGSHKISFSGFNKNTGKYYAIDRNINIAAGTEKIALDLSNTCGVSIGSSFARNPYETIYKLKNLSTASQFEVKYSELPGNIVYVDKGNYDANVELGLSSIKGPVTASYKLDCSGNTSNLVIGKNLRAKVNLDKTIYNPSDAVGLTSVNIFDGDVELKGIGALEFTPNSMDIMHGSKVIKSLPSTISTKLSGETSVRLKLTNEVLGNVVSDIKSIIVNNSTFTSFGDINLDNTVDIFDLVLLSKDYGKKKAVNADWDGRCNLDNSDNADQIDIKDLAKAAQNYNKKY